MTYNERLNTLALRFAKEKYFLFPSFTDAAKQTILRDMTLLAKIALEEMAECYILGYQQSCIDSNSPVVTHHHLLQSLGLVPQN